MQLALTNDERKLMFDRLSEAIEQTGMSLNEYIFASSDLIKTTFWISLSGESDEQANELRDRVSLAINDIIEVLEKHTNNVGEDMLVLSTVMLEAVNHILSAELEDSKTSVEE